MPKPIPYRHRFFLFLLFFVVFLVGFPILLFYSAGYTIDEAFDLSPRGGIYVFTSEPNTSIFVGNELKSRSSFFNREILIDGLKADRYLVLAANDLYWPWAKFVSVSEGIVEPLFPLLVPKVIEAEEVLEEDGDYEDVVELFENSASATYIFGATTTVTVRATSTSGQANNGRLITTVEDAFEPLLRRRVTVWLEGNTVFSEWIGNDNAAPRYFCVDGVCTNPVPIFSSLVPIRHMDFYPSRNDAIILALDNGVYAVEIDRRTYQNFYPLYRGQEPDFRIYRNQVYIQDGDYLVRLNLEL